MSGRWVVLHFTSPNNLPRNVWLMSDYVYYTKYFALTYFFFINKKLFFLNEKIFSVNSFSNLRQFGILCLFVINFVGYDDRISEHCFMAWWWYFFLFCIWGNFFLLWFLLISIWNGTWEDTWRPEYFTSLSYTLHVLKVFYVNEIP